MEDDKGTRMARLASIRYLTQLRRAHEITKGDFIRLKTLIGEDLTAATVLASSSNALNIKIFGNVTLTRRNTPELLEIILSQVPPRDLLVAVKRTCKAFDCAIESSAKLQRLLFRQAGQASRPRPFPIDLPGLKVYSNGEGASHDTELNMILDAAEVTDISKASTALRASQLTQPPTKHLVCLEERINGYSLPRIELETHTGVSDIDGITFGQVMDYAEGKRKGWDETIGAAAADQNTVRSFLLKFACLLA